MSVSIPSDFRPILDSLRPAFLSLSTADLLRPNLSREAALDITHRLTEIFNLHQASLRSVFAESYASEIEALSSDLYRRLWGYYAADLAHDFPPPDSSKQAFQNLASTIRDLDALYSAWAFTLFRDLPHEKPLIDKIRKGKGYQDDGQDVLSWISLFRRYPDLCKSIPDLAPDRLDEAHQTATTFLQSLASDLLSHPSERSPLKDDWYRSYTFWHAAASEIRDSFAFLFRNQPALLDLLPSFSSPRKPKPPTPNPPIAA